MKIDQSITDIEGIKVGHAQDLDALTGCTVILCEEGAVGGVSQRGGAPGTRETDLLRPMHLIEKIHAVVLSGGSAYGLESSGGVMQYLEEKKIGVNTGAAVVPIVPSAILFDLGVGDASVRPGKEMGYQACKNASFDKPNEGNYGAGTGATVGKIFGMSRAMKSGIGTSSRKFGRNVFLAAIVAVNAFGDIVDYKDRKIIAGVRGLEKSPVTIGEKGFFANTLSIMKTTIGKGILSLAIKSNTVIGVIATNASLNKEEANILAESAANGIALSVQPAFTMLDGDTVFAMATGKRKIDANILYSFAPFIFADAILSAVKSADPIESLPSAKNIQLAGE